MKESVAEARRALEAAGLIPDPELDLAGVALQFARVDAPLLDFDAARSALSRLARSTVEAAAADAAADGGDPEARRAVLARVIHAENGFTGDREDYDNPANASLPQVLERRLGLPVALGILWLYAAEAAGWDASGVDFPGHFLVSLAGPRGAALADPFADGTPVSAPDLRALLKRVEGEGAELRPGLLAPMGKRAVLLRLQNNLKVRRQRSGQIVAALECTEDMLRLAPDQAALWREAGMMAARLGRIPDALRCLGRFLDLVPEGESADRARLLIEELRQRLP